MLSLGKNVKILVEFSGRVTFEMETCSKTAQLRKTPSWSLYIPPNLTPTPRKSDTSNLSGDDRGLSESPHSLRMTINLNLFVGLKSNGDKSDDDAPKIINILGLEQELSFCTPFVWICSFSYHSCFIFLSTLLPIVLPVISTIYGVSNRYYHTTL